MRCMEHQTNPLLHCHKTIHRYGCLPTRFLSVYLPVCLPPEGSLSLQGAGYMYAHLEQKKLVLAVYFMWQENERYWVQDTNESTCIVSTLHTIHHPYVPSALDLVVPFMYLGAKVNHKCEANQKMQDRSGSKYMEFVKSMSSQWPWK